MRRFVHEHRRFLLPWGALLGLLVLELVLALLGAGVAAPFIGVAMTALVVTVPMELPEAPNAGRIFALAGAFWLVVALFGLGMLDPLTRHDAPTAFHSEP